MTRGAQNNVICVFQVHYHANDRTIGVLRYLAVKSETRIVREVLAIGLCQTAPELAVM